MKTGASSLAIASLAALVLATLCARQDANAANERTHDTDLRPALSSGDTLEVRGIAGSIDATAGGPGTASIHAHATAQNADPASVKIEIVRSGDRTIVCAVYPGGNCKSNRHDRESGEHQNDDVSVAFTISIPPGVKLVAETVDGNITARALENDVTASAVNGNVKIVTTGLADAHTVSGSIDATFGKLSHDDHVSFETVSGEIHVTLPRDADASINAHTVSGPIEGDDGVGLAVDKSQFVGESGNAKLGSGAASVSLHTVSGSIRVSRS